MENCNNKRLARNTIMLYTRTFLIMLVSLYTSRVILRVLGVSDYGIYNVVGGIVAMIGILNNAMSSATQRYISYELGRGNQYKLKMTFCTSLQIYIIICFMLVFVAETLGVWFLNTQLVIPKERMYAANWVLQLSILASVNQLLVNPFNAAIIAHEKMDVYAYVSILDVCLKLIVVYLLTLISYDKLIVYGFFILICNIIITMIYRVYCVSHFQECRFVFKFDKLMFKKILIFSGWNLYGGIAVLGKTQGLNILLNMFFSTSINAARGISVQINNAVLHFSSSFYTAFRPQIIKYYAQGNILDMCKLVYKSTRFSFYLLYMISYPLILFAEPIVMLWLGQCPDHVIIFTRLILLVTFVDAMANPMMTVVQAIGKLKLYQMVVSSLIILNVPLSYICLKYGAKPEIVFEISLLISSVCFISRIFIINHLISFPVVDYVKTFIRPLMVVLITMPASLFMSNSVTIGVYYLLCNLFLLIFFIFITVYFVGLNRKERNIIYEFVSKKIRKKW